MASASDGSAHLCTVITCVLVALCTVRPAFAEEPTTLLPGNGQSAPVDTTSLQYVYEFASDVQSNLRVKEYIGIINTTRRRCWAEIAQCIQTKQYAKLALQPTQTPFSDLRAAALYCAWALVRGFAGTQAVVCAAASCWSAQQALQLLSTAHCSRRTTQVLTVHHPLLQLQADDYSAAADCRRAYLDFDVHVKDLVQIAEAADLDGANPEQVRSFSP